MQNTTQNTIETAAPLVEAGKKQYTLGAAYVSKLAIAEICQDFERPGSGGRGGVKMSEREALEILFKIATDKRFVTVPVLESLEIDGELVEVQSIDCDGNLMFETLDLIEKEWESIKARDYAESAKIGGKTYQLTSDLQAAMAELKAAQAAQAALLAELSALKALKAQRA